MASLIERWRRLIGSSEETEQSVKSDRRSTASSRESYAQRKTSAKRAVERLVDREDVVPSVTQSLVYTKADRSEKGNSLRDAEEDPSGTKLQTTTVAKMPTLTSEEIKKIVEEALKEANDTEEMKEFLAQRFSVMEGQIMSVRNVQKQEMIAVAVREVREKVDFISLDTRKVGSIKIMLGVSIFCNLITLAVLVAYVLNFL